MTLVGETTPNQFVETTLSEFVNERLVRRVGGRVLLLGAAKIVIGRLAQVREIFPEDGILDREAGEVVQPRDRGELEMMVRLEELEHFQIAHVDLVRRDDAMPTDRLI